MSFLRKKIDAPRIFERLLCDTGADCEVEIKRTDEDGESVGSFRSYAICSASNEHSPHLTCLNSTVALIEGSRYLRPRPVLPVSRTVASSII